MKTACLIPLRLYEHDLMEDMTIQFRYPLPAMNEVLLLGHALHLILRLFRVQ